MIQKIKNNVEYTLAVVLFFLTFFVYFSTMAPTVSFWDTGEFIATSYILGVPHPPGSPLFLLIGKMNAKIFLLMMYHNINFIKDILEKKERKMRLTNY